MSVVLQRYKAFVKKHPSLVLNLERLLHWFAWNPDRFSGSEYAYEGFNAAVGLLGIYNEAILAEHPGQLDTVAKWALWLAAVEQVQTLIELRAIQMEQRGKMSRYGPLIALEVLKCSLRMAMWQSSKCNLALEAVGREDLEQQECEQQLKEMLEALTRLRERYKYDPVTAPTPEHLQYNAQIAHAAAVRAAAVAPCRPPAACAAGLAEAGAAHGTAAALGGTSMLPNSLHGPLGGAKQHEQATLGSSGSMRCVACGSMQHAAGSHGQAEPAPAGSIGLQQPEQHATCKACGRLLIDPINSKQQLGSFSEITPADASDVSVSVSQQNPAPAAKMTGKSSGSGMRHGWWQRLTSPGSIQRQQTQTQDQRQQQQQGQPLFGLAGALPGSWGPALRPNRVTQTSCSSSTSTSNGSSASERLWQRTHEQQLWCLSHRDAGIGRSVMWVGELVHVMRPLVYVILLKRYGLTSWKPWLMSFALDLASGYGLHTGHAILEHSNASKWPVGSTLYSLALLRSLSNTRWSPGEQQELMVRRVQLLRYLLRSPCYSALTRRLLLKVVAGSRWMPGLSSLTEFAFSMIEGMQSYYTYVES